MEIFDGFLSKIEVEEHRIRTQEILSWVHNQYPQLDLRIAWNQPMFTHHGTFIVAFSLAKHHIAITPEKAGIDHFSEEIEKTGYSFTNMIVRIPWSKPVDFTLLTKMIDFNIEDKKDCESFWRK